MTFSRRPFFHSTWIGFLAGVFGGLMGVGGGLIMIPLMVTVLKISQHKAHGTSLLALIFTGISGAIAYGIKGEVDFSAGLILAVTATIAAVGGARFAGSLPEWKLKRSFGAFLIFASIILISKPFIMTHYGLNISGAGKIFGFLTVGIFTGFLAGMMGIGGGTVTVPALVVLFNFSQHMAQGTSLLCMIPAGAMGSWTHWRLKNVVSELLPGLIIGITIGTALGSNTALILPENILRVLFASIVCWMGFRFLNAPKPQKEMTEEADEK